jgi:hypothetical protein
MGSFSSIKGGGPSIVRYDGKTGDWKIPGQDKSEPLNGHSGVADVYSAMRGFVRYGSGRGRGLSVPSWRGLCRWLLFAVTSSASRAGRALVSIS